MNTTTLSMRTEIDADDLVELTVDLPKFGLNKGTQGKVFEVRQFATLFEVEFPDQPTNIVVSIRQCRKVE